MRKVQHSGIYLLPNLLTTASLFAAFYSLVASMKGQYESAIIAIFIGMIADCLDGRIARLTNTQSVFGAQYDSLSDLVTFGVAPSILLYQLALAKLGKLGWLIAFVYTAAVALRLARFNTQLEVADKRYFQGLPCPPSAGIVASYAWLACQGAWTGFVFDYLTAGISLGLAVLMVSNLRYYSFKDIDFKGKVPFIYILIMVILFVSIAMNPALVLFLGFSCYGSYGPIQTILSLHRVKRIRKRIRKKA